jgi:hypothetical protein
VAEILEPFPARRKLSSGAEHAVSYSAEVAMMLRTWRRRELAHDRGHFSFSTSFEI